MIHIALNAYGLAGDDPEEDLDHVQPRPRNVTLPSGLIRLRIGIDGVISDAPPDQERAVWGGFKAEGSPPVWGSEVPRQGVDGLAKWGV